MIEKLNAAKLIKFTKIARNTESKAKRRTPTAIKTEKTPKRKKEKKPRHPV